jgi:hypothetical protein
MRDRFIRPTLHAVVLTLAAAALAGCASSEQVPRQVGEVPDYGTVRLALSSDDADLAARIELRFDPAGGGDPIVDVFAVGVDASWLSRDYRLPPGEYDISALGAADDGATVLEGASPGTLVEPGDNVVVLPLSRTGEAPLVVAHGWSR